MDSRETLLGVAPVGDPRRRAPPGGGRGRAVVPRLHPAPPLPADGDDAGAEHDAAAASAAAAATEASAELRTLAGGFGRVAPPPPPADAAGLRPGTAEGNVALAPRWRVSASAIFGTRTGYTRRHGDTPFVSAPNFSDSARRRRRFERGWWLSRRDERTYGRESRSQATHEDIRARLRKLAQLERTPPHPLTRAELALRTTLRKERGRRPLLRARRWTSCDAARRR